LIKIFEGFDKNIFGRETKNAQWEKREMAQKR
jgi:hypothetical protein